MKGTVDPIATLNENDGHSRQDHPIKAAYASDAVINIISKKGFSSLEAGRLFRARSCFTSRLTKPRDIASTDSIENSRFIGAVLSKLARRGVPAPCSLRVERYVLQRAQDRGVLNFEEYLDSNNIKFSCTPLIKDLDSMVKACCLPELLVEDQEIANIIEYYRSFLDSVLKIRFFNKLISLLPDKRLALLIIPQTLMTRNKTENASTEAEDHVDFRVEIPNVERDSYLRIAIIIEEITRIADVNHLDDLNPNAILEDAGWIVRRFEARKAQNWDNEIRKLIDLISQAIPDNILKAAKELRGLPIEKKSTIQDLILLPVAEAQITQAIGDSLSKGETSEFVIGNPQNLDLDVVLEAVTETIDAIMTLYDVRFRTRLKLAKEDNSKIDFEYFSIPSRKAFAANEIDLITAWSCIVPINFNIIPKKIDMVSEDRKKIARESLEYILNNIFRLEDFLNCQIDLIEKIISLDAIVGKLETRGYESLCYQLASIIQPGFALIVVPSESSMIEQREELASIGIHRCKVILDRVKKHETLDINSQNSTESGGYNFVFATAEALQIHDYRDQINAILSITPMNSCIILDAHYLSEWGLDFRPAYVNAIRWLIDNRSFHGYSPSMVALTTTNSRIILMDILHEFCIKDLDAIVESPLIDLDYLQFNIRKVNSKELIPILIAELRAILRKFGWRAGEQAEIPRGLIITPYGDDEEIGLIRLAKAVRDYLNIPVGIYSIEAPKRFLNRGGSKLEWEQTRLETFMQFKSHKLPILICSPITAIGIDNEDIVFIIHTSLPSSLDEFYQGCGKKGHKERQHNCVIFFSDDPPGFSEEIIGKYKIKSEIILEDASQVNWALRGDALRNFRQLAEEFPGRQIEKRLFIRVFSELFSTMLNSNSEDNIEAQIGIESIPKNLFFNYKNLSRKKKNRLLEKVLYRLLLIGAIEGYYKKNDDFHVELRLKDSLSIHSNYKKYINRYIPEGLASFYFPKDSASTYKNATLKCGCKMIDFCYYKIKYNRSEAIGKMLHAARESQVSPLRFRENLYAQRDKSKFKEIAARLASSSISEPWWRVISEMKSSDELLELCFACREELNYYPANPILLIVEGFCATACLNMQKPCIELTNGFLNLKKIISEAEDRIEIANHIIELIDLLVPSKLNLILDGISDGDSSPELSRLCYERCVLQSGVYYSSLFKLIEGILGIFESKKVSS